jgi:hypothetical protein
MKIERRSVGANICDWGYGLDKCRRHKDGRAQQFCDVDVQLRHVNAAHSDRHGVLARVARVRVQRPNTLVFGLVAMVVSRYRWLMVFVCRRAVVMVRVIVADILVHVQRRPNGSRCHEGVREHDCDQRAHDP